MGQEILVIGYGNSLRSDDGAGISVAETLAQQQRENLRSLAVHQLTPELAADIANSDKVIFVDAAINLASVTVQSLEPEPRGGEFGHTGNPRSLLFLTQAVYGLVPPAWWVLIPGVNFEFGEQFSAITEEGIGLALKEIEKLINSNPSYTITNNNVPGR